MSRKSILRLCGLGLAGWLAFSGWERVKGDDLLTLLYFIILGLVIGLLVVIYVLPRFGDAMGNLVYSSGEQIQPAKRSQATELLAQGDFEGAIKEHEKSLAADPGQSFIVAEIAKICAERLGDPSRARQVLEKNLAAHQWPEDEAIFLRFRLAHLHLHHLQDPTTARTLLEALITEFPNTRHIANARHKLSEVNEAEYKMSHRQPSRAPSPPKP